MMDRCKLQAKKDIPESALTTNDRCETLNGTGKYHHRNAPNIDEKSKAALAIENVNKDCWNTFDYMIEKQPKQFETAIVTWMDSCNTYKQAIAEDKQYKSNYKALKVKKIKLVLSRTAKAIPKPKPKSQIAKLSIRSPIKLSFPPLNHPIWNYWVRQRGIIVSKYKGLLITKQQQMLREEIRSILKYYKMFSFRYINTAGLEKLQRDLYTYCKKQIDYNKL